MKIFTDMDGVKADTMPGLNAFYNRRNGTNFRVGDYRHHDLERTWGGTKEDAVRNVTAFYHSREFLTIGPIRYAPESVFRLSQRCEFFSITSRPEIIRPQTEQFLERYFPGIIRKVFYTGQHSLSASEINKLDICLQEAADVLIEDCLETAISCSEGGLRVFLLDFPWNQTNGHSTSLPKNLTRVKNWLGIEAILK